MITIVTYSMLSLEDCRKCHAEMCSSCDCFKAKQRMVMGVNAVPGCAKCQTSTSQTRKHQNATVQSYASAFVLSHNLTGSWTE